MIAERLRGKRQEVRGKQRLILSWSVTEAERYQPSFPGLTVTVTVTVTVTIIKCTNCGTAEEVWHPHRKLPISQDIAFLLIS